MTLRESLEVVRHLTPDATRTLAASTPHDPMLQSVCVWRLAAADPENIAATAAFDALLRASKVGPLVTVGQKRHSVLDALSDGHLRTASELVSLSGLTKGALLTAIHRLRMAGSPIVVWPRAKHQRVTRYQLLQSDQQAA